METNNGNVFKKVCAWCKRFTLEGVADVAAGLWDGDEIVSHGLCVDCEAKYFPTDLKDVKNS